VNGAKGSPQQTRAQDSAFVQQCSLRQLSQQLPLSWPTPAGQPASPKKRYRSAYRYPWAEVCRDPGQVQAWLELGDFDLALRLVDFSGLRPVLAQCLGWKSGRGWEPFDPVSFFLLYQWQIGNRWTRQEMLKHLAEERYADYAAWFGFQNGVFPTEGGMRYFLTRLGSQSEASGEQVMVELEGNKIAVAVQQLNQLLVQAVELVRQAGLLSPAAWEQGLVCPDGQIHDAASRLRCISVTRAVTSRVTRTSRGSARPKPKSGRAALVILWPAPRFAGMPLPATHRRVSSSIPLPTSPQAAPTPLKLPTQKNPNMASRAMATAACPCAWRIPAGASA
jgi:hypothetical protein